MGKKLRLDFLGESGKKQELYDSARACLIDFVQEKHTLYWGFNGFVMMICEMIKNILDHAHGYGYVFIQMDETTISFEVKDFGKESFDYESLKKKTPKGKGDGINGVNYGLGLGLIQGCAEGLNITLTIDTSSGFSYKGQWVYNSTNQEHS